MKRILFVVALAMISATTLFAQSKLSNYTELILNSRQNMTADQFLKSPMSKTVYTVNNAQTIDCFVHFAGAIDESVLAKYGAKRHCRYDFANIVTAEVPLDAVEALAADPQIKLVEAGLPIEQHLNYARPSSTVTLVHDGAAPLTKSYLGRGVILGVVDTEMQFDHPAFWSTDHSRFRIKRVWLQGSASSYDAPVEFGYGKEITDSAAILKQAYDTRSMSSGHATHVTGIAAGADHTLDYYGVAQEADIVFVSADRTGYHATTSIPDGIKYCFDYADEVGKPCVVNVSMGSNIGTHDGLSTESIIIDGLVGPGRIACGSAGNEGDVKLHCGKMLGGNDSTFTTFFKKSYGSEYYYADIYGESDQDYGIQLISYNKEDKLFSYASPLITTSGKSFNVDTVIEGYGRLKLAGRATSTQIDTSRRRNITVTITKIDSVPNRHDIGIRVISSDSGMVNMWTLEDYNTFGNSQQKQDGIIDGDCDYTICEPMGTTKGVVSVGSYTTYAKYSSQTVGALSSFSSKGPTADNRIKPDIAAPGEMLMSAYPDIDKISSDRAASTVVGGKTYYYALMQGTSMSAPYCSGVIATWLEADPTLDVDRIIDVFHHTTCLDSFTGDASDKPNNSWGYGKLNAYQGLLYILGLTTQVQDVTTTGVLAAYPNPTSDILNIGFPADDSNVRVSVYDLSGKCVYNNVMSNVSAGENLEVNVSSLTPGAYLVRVNGDKIADTFKLMKE